MNINTKNGNVQNSNDSSLSFFMNVCKEALDISVTFETKIRLSNGPFMNKDRRKAVMKRARLESSYLKGRCYANRKAHNAQRGLCVSLARKVKFNYYNKLGHK